MYIVATYDPGENGGTLSLKNGKIIPFNCGDELSDLAQLLICYENGDMTFQELYTLTHRVCIDKEITWLM
jgi:hypothetical protein